VALAGVGYELYVYSPTPIYTGESTTVNFQIKNLNSFWDGHFAYRLDSGSWSTYYEVGAGETRSFSVTVQAPPWGSGSGSALHTIYANGYDTFNSTPVYKDVPFYLEYSENPTYIEKSNAETAINNAQNALSTASTGIASAKGIINDARNLGADVKDAELKLTSAQSFLESAQSKLSNANTYFSSENYELAISTANEATNLANSAKSDANSAYNLGLQAKQAIEIAKNNAQNAIQKADQAIKSANSAIETAKAAITNVKSTGADVSTAQVLLDTATTNLNSASSKYTDANSNFNNKNYDAAKQLAEQAESYAIDAETEAKTAESTATQIKVKYESEQGQAELKLTQAQNTYNTAVGLTDQVNMMITHLSEMDVDTSGFKSDLEKATVNLLDAKGDVEEKAKNRYDGGEYDDSKKYSLQSLDVTEKAIADLQNLLYNMALSAQEVTLDKQSKAKSSYESSLSVLETNKHRLSGDIYASQQTSLNEANKNIENGLSIIENAKTNLNSKNYVDAINLYRNAFSEFSNAEILSHRVESAINATMGENLKRTIMTYGGIGGGIVLLLVSVVLLLRRRKIKGKDFKRTCPKCGATLLVDAEFCPKCGTKVSKENGDE
jgi:hypothetical protein